MLIKEIDLVELIKVLDIKGGTACIFVLYMCGKMDIIIEKLFALINTILCNRDNMIYRFGRFCKYLITQKIKNAKNSI